jgi:NAD(P)-dependent dehydrogenase (short-subunit alcohol dehydrogenase family)
MPRSDRRARLALAGATAAVTLGVREAIARAREADLRGEVAFVTGGTRGLGLLLARQLGREGCRVAICGRDEEQLQRAIEDLREHDIEALGVVCDVADPASVEDAVGRITRELGPIGILINNAGVIAVGSMDENTADDFRFAHDILFWGVLYPTLAVLPSMRARRRGRIANITSIAARISVPHLVPYSTAKFAALGLSEGLRAELRQDGIIVTSIVPGLMRTGSYRNALFKRPRDREFTWFALASTLPVITIDAERAASQIVRALKRGEAERTLSVPALLAARVHGLFPGATTDLLAIVSRFLPREPGGGPSDAERGLDIERRLDQPALKAATTLGRDAAARFQDPDAARGDGAG